MNSDFDKNVFINCPFDKDFEPILIAMLFCIVYLGLNPRLATESGDSAENRLQKICGLIEQSRYSIHDLSRAQATKKGQHFRLNMPFELGIDYGYRRYFAKNKAHKKILILEEKRYRHQISISDLAGCDLEIHEGSFQVAIRKVRNWLVNEAGIAGAPGPGRILNAYTDFQDWHYQAQLHAGFSDEDIQDYPIRELLDSMKKWISSGQP